MSRDSITYDTFSNVDAMFYLSEALVTKTPNRPLLDLLVLLELVRLGGERGKSDLVTNFGFTAGEDAAERSLRRLEGEGLISIDYEQPINDDFRVRLAPDALSDFAQKWRWYKSLK